MLEFTRSLRKISGSMQFPGPCFNHAAFQFHTLQMALYQNTQQGRFRVFSTREKKGSTICLMIKAELLRD